MKYGERLKRARKIRGFTQKMLAEKSGVAQQSTSKIERCDQDSSAHDAALAHALTISTIWLSKEIGDMDDIVVTEEEKQLILAYRSGSADKKKVFELLSKDSDEQS